MVLLPEFTGLSFDSDNDGVINPGEEILLEGLIGCNPALYKKGVLTNVTLN